MSAPLLVVVLIAAGEAHAPATAAIQAAAVDALGPDSSVVVQEIATPSDGEALRVENRLHATAVVELLWSHPAKANVRIRIHVARADRWIDRDMAFGPADTMAERGRTIGFAIASMLLPETEAPTSPVASTIVVPDPGGKPNPDAVAGAATLEKSAPNQVRELVSPSRAFDLSAVGTVGLSGPANGFGGAARIEFSIVRALWLRAGAGIRTGAVPRLNGNDMVSSAAIGVAWRPYATTPVKPFGGGLRLDAGIFFHDLTHRTVDGSLAHRGRLIPGAVLAAEGTWRLTQSFDVVFVLGSEIAFGTTEVVVAGQLVATIPVFRGLAELGARIRF